MRERDLFQVITLSKYVLKIIVHYSLLDLRSNMVITDLLPGAPWVFLLAVLRYFFIFLDGTTSRLHISLRTVETNLSA